MATKLSQLTLARFILKNAFLYFLIKIYAQSHIAHFSPVAVYRDLVTVIRIELSKQVAANKPIKARSMSNISYKLLLLPSSGIRKKINRMPLKCLPIISGFKARLKYTLVTL